MSLSIEKVENGFIVSHHEKRQVATALHVANFICLFWPEVAQCIYRRLMQEQGDAQTVEGDSPPQSDSQPPEAAISNY